MSKVDPKLASERRTIILEEGDTRLVENGWRFSIELRRDGDWSEVWHDHWDLAQNPPTLHLIKAIRARLARVLSASEPPAQPEPLPPCPKCGSRPHANAVNPNYLRCSDSDCPRGAPATNWIPESEWRAIPRRAPERETETSFTPKISPEVWASFRKALDEFHAWKYGAAPPPAPSTSAREQAIEWAKAARTHHAHESLQDSLARHVEPLLQRIEGMEKDREAMLRECQHLASSARDLHDKNEVKSAECEQLRAGVQELSDERDDAEQRFRGMCDVETHLLRKIELPSRVPSEPKAGTVRVRVLVSMMSEGDWLAFGQDDIDDDEEAHTRARIEWPRDCRDELRFCWLTADVPLPVASPESEIRAEVSDAE